MIGRTIKPRRTRVASFNDFDGLLKNGVRNRHAEGLSGLKIYTHFDSCWPLHREVGGFGALENLVGESGSAAVDIKNIGPIGDEASTSGEQLPLIDGRQLIIHSTLDNLFSLNGVHRVDQHDKAVSALLGHRREGVVKIIHFRCFDDLNLYTERTCSA